MHYILNILKPAQDGCLVFYGLPAWSSWFVDWFLRGFRYLLTGQARRLGEDQLKWKWHDIRPSMVTHTRNLCSTFNPSKVHTHSSEHTHTVNTHPEQWAAINVAAPGEQLGVRCLAHGHLSRGIEGGELYIHAPHLQFLLDLRLEPATFWVMSPTL